MYKDTQSINGRTSGIDQCALSPRLIMIPLIKYNFRGDQHQGAWFQQQYKSIFFNDTFPVCLDSSGFDAFTKDFKSTKMYLTLDLMLHSTVLLNQFNFHAVKYNTPFHTVHSTHVLKQFSWVLSLDLFLVGYTFESVVCCLFLPAATKTKQTHPLGADTPPRSSPPPEQTTPGADQPWSRPPWSRHPPPGADPPPPGSRLRHTIYERPVHILLECILVFLMFLKKKRLSFRFFSFSNNYVIA